jgi:hypothetical protein
VRAALAALVVLAADIALFDIEAGRRPSPTLQWLLVAAPLPTFVVDRLLVDRLLVDRSVVSRNRGAVPMFDGAVCQGR